MKSKNSKNGSRKTGDEIDWSAADAMTDKEVEAAAKADPDAKPLPKGWFKRAAKRRAARKTAAE